MTGFHRVDGRVFPLAELTGRQHGPSTRLVETGLKGQGPTFVSNRVSTSVNPALTIVLLVCSHEQGNVGVGW